MTTLTDFLLARIAEDERMAHDFDEAIAREFGTPSESLLSSELTLAGSGYMDYPVLTVDSTRVLAECEAKRRIVEDLTDSIATYGSEPTVFTEGRRFGLMVTLGHLATVYADHPDYDEAWRP